MFKKSALFVLVIINLFILSPVFSQHPPVLRPLMWQQFAKTISDGTFCMGDICNQKGVVEYHRDGNYMTINALFRINKYGQSYMKIALNTLKKFLNYQSDIYNKDINAVFNQCLDYACVPLGEIHNISYPGMDTCRGIYILETQGTYEGNINLRIFASKGNDYVLLSKSTYLATHNQNNQPNGLYKACLNQTGISYNSTDSDAFLNCYRNKLQNNTEIQKILRTEANALIDFFRIK